jgi:tetratricopeptide (TPR) repeat protein
MRLAKELLPMRRHLRRLRQCFESVHRYLGSSGPMTSVKLSNEDGRIVLYRGGAWIEPESGQLLFRFDHGEAAGEVEERFRQARVQGRLWEARAAAESDPGLALTIYRELAQLDPRSFEVRIELARALRGRGDLDAALSHARAAVELRPAELRAHLEAARILQERGELEEAWASLQSALQCDARSAETHRALAEIYERLGRKNEALKHLSAAHRLSRDA